MLKFIPTILNFDNCKKSISINKIETDQTELSIPSEIDGLPVTHIGYESKYCPAERHWIDYHHFKDEIIPAHWELSFVYLSLPECVRKLYLPDTVTDLGLYIYKYNKKVEVIINPASQKKDVLEADLRRAKDILNG